VEEVDPGGSVLARYAHSEGVDEPLSELRGATVAFYEQDGLGSVTSLSGSSGTFANSYIYDSFGNLGSSTGSLVNPFQYTGRDSDSETGLRYYRARYYDPTSGRFLSEDPFGLRGGVNKFNYVRGNPVNATDPMGLLTVYVWRPRPGDAFGHAAMILDDGTNISWWPEDTSTRTPKKPCDCDKDNYIYTAPNIPDQKVLDGQGSALALEEHPPDAVIHLTLLNEKNILAWWDKYKANNHTWGSLSPNCSTIVAEAMLAGGAIPVTGLPMFGMGGAGTWSPIDIELFADVEAIREGAFWTMITTSTFGRR
jgi:RHS repeat-associated protein